MKWESAPLWPVAIPSIIGLLLSFIPYLSDIEYFSTRNLIAPILILAVLGLSCMLLPERYGSKIELYNGYIVALFLAYSFRFFFGFYGIVVIILVWVGQSTYIWQYNFPPFRIGIWMALGAISGLYIGGIMAYNLF
ncbi:MAG: hypothetical protein OR994_07120 [Candidatus Poseidoniales archaeon]|jgi:hypothetical protein|nr:hypothetical protein [Candidatus Poseidoniales archaeon]|tara:strand:- start:2067 stop:2474 length:408 start_codon:yes stop_codon:yes gene_type:complete